MIQTLALCLILCLPLIAPAATTRTPPNDPGMLMDRWADAVASDGWSDALEDEVEAAFDGASLILLGEDETVLRRTGESDFDEGDTANFLLSRYRYPYIVDGKPLSAGVALLIDERGDALSAFRAVYSPDPVGMGKDAYARYYPDIGKAAYEKGQWYYDELGGLTGDLWYYLEDELVLGKKARLQVVDYINWERELIELGSCPNLIYRALPDGGALALIYREER